MIVPMRHLDLVCLASRKDETLAALRALGAVHLDLSSASGSDFMSLKGDFADAERAVRLILKARAADSSVEIRPHSVAEVLGYETDRQTLVSERDRLEREIRKYEPYGDFDPVLAAKLLVAGIDDIRDELPEKLPEMRLSKMQEKFARVVNRIAIDEAKLAGSDEQAILKSYPVLKDRILFAAAKEQLRDHGELAVVSGWVPEPCAADVLGRAKTEGWAVLLRECEADEMPPTLVEPPKIFRPMKALFDGLGIAPAYTESDVSVPFMCYFSLFFAMLVGDGAYGAIFLIVTLLLRKKLPNAWFVLMTVFSAATVGWGALSNTWFGAGISWCTDWTTVTWLADPSYRNIMLLCFTIGVSHLMLARLWNGICKLPDSTAIAEFGWAGVLLFMYFVTNSLVGIFPSIPGFMNWVFGASLVAVFGFTVKPSELKSRGIELGMLPLSIMSALGDIISYVRLFAVGLASVKVAENFNSMATTLVSATNPWWLNVLMSVAMVLILLAGHGLNLAMAGLSVLVHAVRLNTLEFSNHKGISWAGYAFRPFVKH